MSRSLPGGRERLRKRAPMSNRRALVVGATGLTGRNTAEHLAATGWEVHGMSRHPGAEADGVRPVAGDALDPASVTAVAEQVRATHVFYCTWLRQHTVIGYALGNAMNMGVTLAAYGTLAKETGRPFVFPGSPEQYDGTTDITDARLLARHLAWAATSPAAANEAFNVVNGDTFHWRRMWEVVASGLGVKPAPYPGHPTPLVEQMTDAPQTWRRIAEREGLTEPDVDRLAPWWHTD